MDISVKEAVVALENCGYQCQYVEGTLIASRGTSRVHLVEDADGNAVGTFPSDVLDALDSITEDDIEKRFGQQTLFEMGYGDFSPSKASPTGTEEPGAARFKTKPGDNTVTDEDPKKPKGMKGVDNPVDDTELPDDFGGDNNQDADVPSTGGGTDATTVGAHGGSGGGKGAGPTDKKPEKTQAMQVGYGVYQGDSPDREKGDRYTGTEVGEIKGGGRSQGKKQSSIATAGTMPAKFPGDQPAQSEPDIPGKVGKMTVTGSTVESVLYSLDEQETPDEMADAAQQEAQQMVEQHSDKTMAVLQRDENGSVTAGESWEPGWTSEDWMKAEESVNEYVRANPQGGAAIVFPNDEMDQLLQSLSENPNTQITEVGELATSQGTVESVMEKRGRKAGKTVDKKGSKKGRGRAAKYVADETGGSVDVDEAKVVEETLKRLPKSFGILGESPVIGRKTLRRIDLKRWEERLTPVLARMILEQDDDEEDASLDAGPPMGGMDDMGGEDPGMDDMGGTDVDIDMGGEEDPGAGGPGMGMDAGAPEPGGAPVDIDIGGGPEPQPSGMGTGAEVGPGSPELPEFPDGGRLAQLQSKFPDASPEELEDLFSVGVVGDLYTALVQQVMAKKDEVAGDLAQAQQDLVASVNPHKKRHVTTKSSRRADESISRKTSPKQLQNMWEDDPNAFVDALVDGLMRKPDRVGLAASLVLGLKEGDYRERDVQEAASILQGLGDEIYQIRDQVQNIRLNSVGKVQALVSSKFSRGAFASEAQQMFDQLKNIEEALDSYLVMLDRWEEQFNSQYGMDVEMGGEAAPVSEPDMGGEQVPPMGGEAGGEEPMSPPPMGGEEPPPAM